MAGYIGTKASVVSSGAERKKVFSITGTTTSLTGLSYTPNQVHVFHNGVRLVDGTDYTATNGTSITLVTAAENGDEVVVISYATFQAADAYTKADSDSRYVNVTGDTMTGNLTTSGALQSATFSDGTVSVGSTYLTNGSSKAWANLNGVGTIALRDSFNLSSVTDSGVGLYDFTFTSAFSDANRSGQTDLANSTTDTMAQVGDSSLTPTASTMRTLGLNGGGTALKDLNYNYLLVHGDLA